MKYYGMPYKGSKNSIAENIIAEIPDADVFVDLFGGGGAIAHCAARSGRYKKVIYNELEPLVYNGFVKAISGGYANERRWISREDFHRLKAIDPYAAMCFSFGSVLDDYAYSKEVEPWKKALHYARVFGDTSEFEKFGIHTDGTRYDIIKHHDEYKKKYIAWYMKNVLKSDQEYQIEKAELEKNIKEESDKLRAYLINARDAAGLKSSDVDRYLGTNGMAGRYFGRSQWEFPTREVYIKLQKIMPELNQDYEKIVGLSTLWQSLQSLQSLQRLQSLESLRTPIECYNLSYEQVPIPNNSVIYCDIPYIGTDEYLTTFDHAKFYDWCRQQAQAVYISEYQMPEDFHEVMSWQKTSKFSSTSAKVTTEKLFCTRKIDKPEQLSFFV